MMTEPKAIVSDLESFVAIAKQVIADTRDKKAIPGKLKPYLEQLIRHREWLDERFRQPNPDAFAVYTLHQEPDDSLLIMSAVFLPGQGTPVHDHAVWGLYGVMENQTEDTRYERIDDRSRPDYAELRVVDRRLVRQGEVMISYPPDQDIHRVVNTSDKPTLEIHVYGADLSKLRRRVYDPQTGRVKVIQARVPVN
ncbi:MAG: hypothetical protein D6723_03470 [Acidobacteria bacterium]|nr:MAG: hypothetical protein D6723_03470 [Acidobacteriota bacterium]